MKDYKWAELVPNEADWFSSSIRCGVCHKWSRYFNVNKRFETNISKKEGIFKQSRPEYLNALLVHSKSPQHESVMNKLEDRTLEDIEHDDYQFSLGENFDDGSLLITTRMIRTVSY